MVVEMVAFSTFWWNSFPPEGGVSETLSPRAIVVSLDIDFVKHCQLDFGTYVQTHEEHTNSMASRTVGAIAMRPTGNEQGGYYFFSLNTGRRLNRNQWTVLPMPTEVIERVHALARRSAAAQGLTFTNRQGEPDNDDSDSDADASYDPDDDSDNGDDDASIIYDDNHNHRPDTGANDANNNNNSVDNDNWDVDDNNEDDHNDDGDDHVDADDKVDNVVDNDDNVNDTNTESDASGDDESSHDDDESSQNSHKDQQESQAEIAEQMDLKYGARSGVRELRPRKPRDFGHLHALLDTLITSQHEIWNMKPRRSHEQYANTTLAGIALSQHSMKKGIKLFGQAGIEAVQAELHQLHERKVLLPKDSAKLTHGEKRSALQYLMFLKQKRCGKIKGRGCADGRKQREYI
jgi:hypothetical protein